MIATKDQLEAVVTSLQNILQTCHVTSVLSLPIKTFEECLTYSRGYVLDMTISTACADLLRCIHDEEDSDNPDVAERLRDVLRSMEGSNCRG